MKLSTMTRITYIATPILALLSVFSVLTLYSSLKQERIAVRTRAELKQLGIDLADASDFLTDEARRYVVEAETVHEKLYWEEIEVTKTRDRVLTRLKELGATEEEFGLLALAKQNSDALVATETRAMRLMAAYLGLPDHSIHPAIASWQLSTADLALSPEGKLNKAREIMFDDQYDADKAIIMGPVADFQTKMNTRAEQEVQSRQRRNSQMMGLTAGILGLFIAALALFVYTLRSMISRPVRLLTDFVTDAKQNLSATMEVSISERTEIGQLAASFREMVEDVRESGSKVEEAMNAAQAAVNAVNQTVEQLQIGDLSARASLSGIQGEYRALLEGFNSAIDAILDPISEASTVLEQLAARDLTVRVTGDYQGDHAKIKESLNLAAQNLEESLQQVSSSAEQVSSATTQIGSGSQSVAQASSEQASSLEEIASSLQEMTSMTTQNTSNAKEARSISDAAKTAVEGGVDSMGQLSNAIDRIKTSSDETSRIVKTIDEIAFQTNLLALNAAVEAARAGEAGKGFAVVAEEVRSLAMRSAEAAKDTARLIEDAVKNSEDGVSINQEVTQQLADISTHVNKVSEMMGEIAAASEQQSEGIDQVNAAVELMNQVTQQTAANSEESASTAARLSGQAEELRTLVGRFQLSQSMRHTQNHTRVVDRVSPPVPAQLGSESSSFQDAAGNGNGNGKEQSLTPEQLIPLDDADDAMPLDNNILQSF